MPPTINVPSQPQPAGATVTVTGSAEKATAAFIVTHEGSTIPYDVAWNGEAYTLTFTAPTPKTEDVVDVTVEDQHGDAIGAVDIMNP